jgi:tetratricopeptide (TPR) repeat protein
MISRTLVAYCASVVCITFVLYRDGIQNSVPAPTIINSARKGKDQVAAAKKDQKLLAEAMITLTEALKANSDDPVALFAMGWALQGQGRPTESAQHYRRALEKAQEIVALSNFNLSFITEANGDLAGALRQVEEALKNSPSFAAASRRIQALRQSIASGKAG